MIKPYIFFFSLTIHYCLDDLTLKKALFGATEITEATTAENIKSAILEYLQFIGLDAKKMVCVVRDDAANVKKAVRLMEKDRLVNLLNRSQLDV
jgi:hypothetical protein